MEIPRVGKNNLPPELKDSVDHTKAATHGNGLLKAAEQYHKLTEAYADNFLERHSVTREGNQLPTNIQKILGR